MQQKRNRVTRCLILFLGAIAAPAFCPATELSFEVTLDPSFQKDAYSGRVYVVISKNLHREPRRMMGGWFQPPLLLARDMVHHSPHEPIVIGVGAMANPHPLSELEPGQYQVQAIARRNLDSPRPGRGAGDLYSDPEVLTLDFKTAGPVALRLDKVVESRSFDETDRVKLVDIRSTALSTFYNRDVHVRAGVILPEGWDKNVDQVYPVLYMIPGFGGDHRMARFLAGGGMGNAFKNILLVVPDPSCYLGHSVFADSQNNGPRGLALVHELIPEVERRYRGAESGEHRYVMGVSSGGWSCLWLQVTYPDSFNGCWAHCPDPVDFRDFQRINLYEPGANMYTDKSGQRRPLARDNGKVDLWYDDFVHREDVLGPGGQIHSFEAVFSPRSDSGLPQLLFDRKTGAVFTETAKAWEPYDIRLVLERNWPTLGPKLSGKLHIYAGEIDTFYLEGAVRLLKKSLEKLGSDAEVRIIDGMAHGMYAESIQPMVKTIEDNFAKAYNDKDKNNKPTEASPDN